MSIADIQLTSIPGGVRAKPDGPITMGEVHTLLEGLGRIRKGEIEGAARSSWWRTGSPVTRTRQPSREQSHHGAVRSDLRRPGRIAKQTPAWDREAAKAARDRVFASGKPVLAYLSSSGTGVHVWLRCGGLGPREAHDRASRLALGRVQAQDRPRCREGPQQVLPRVPGRPNFGRGGAADRLHRRPSCAAEGPWAPHRAPGPHRDPKGPQGRQGGCHRTVLERLPGELRRRVPLCGCGCSWRSTTRRRSRDLDMGGRPRPA